VSFFALQFAYSNNLYWRSRWSTWNRCCVAGNPLLRQSMIRWNRHYSHRQSNPNASWVDYHALLDTLEFAIILTIHFPSNLLFLKIFISLENIIFYVTSYLETSPWIVSSLVYFLKFWRKSGDARVSEKMASRTT